MLRKVFLHVGHQRNGTTSIQNFADRNREILMARGLLYPCPHEMRLPREVSRRTGNARALYEYRNSTATLRSVVSYLERQSSPSALMSSEYLFNLDETALWSIRQEFEAACFRVIVIVYVRDQRDWLLSRYAQSVKTKRLALSPADFVLASHAHPRLSYLSALRVFCDVFDKENVVCRLYDRGAFSNGDIRTDIFDVVGVGVDDLICDQPSENRSASIEQIRAIQAMGDVTGPQLFNPSAFIKATDAIAERRGIPLTRSLFRFVSPRIMQRVANYHALGNELVRREFFPEQIRPLFPCSFPSQYEQLDDRSAEVTDTALLLLAEYFQSRLRARRAEESRKPEASRTFRDALDAV